MQPAGTPRHCHCRLTWQMSSGGSWLAAKPHDLCLQKLREIHVPLHVAMNPRSSIAMWRLPDAIAGWAKAAWFSRSLTLASVTCRVTFFRLLLSRKLVQMKHFMSFLLLYIYIVYIYIRGCVCVCACFQVNMGTLKDPTKSPTNAIKTLWQNQGSTHQLLFWGIWIINIVVLMTVLKCVIMNGKIYIITCKHPDLALKNGTSVAICFAISPSPGRPSVFLFVAMILLFWAEVDGLRYSWYTLR